MGLCVDKIDDGDLSVRGRRGDVNGFNVKIIEMSANLSILCLISRTTVTSLSALKDKRCKTHHLCVNPERKCFECLYLSLKSVRMWR